MTKEDIKNAAKINLCKCCIESSGKPCEGCMECENRGYYYGFIEGTKFILEHIKSMTPELSDMVDEHFNDVIW